MPIQLIRRALPPLSPHNALHSIILNTFRFIIIRTCNEFISGVWGFFFCANRERFVFHTEMPFRIECNRQQCQTRMMYYAQEMMYDSFVQRNARSRLFLLKKHSFLFFHSISFKHFVSRFFLFNNFSFFALNWILHFFFCSFCQSVHFILHQRNYFLIARKKIRNLNIII